MQKATRRVWSIFLAFMMLISMLPMSVSAEEGDIATIVDSGSFASLEDAFEAADDGATIQLIGDTAINNAVNVTKTVTLDLNGYDITSNGLAFYVDTDDVVFTIQDNNDGTGSVKSTKTNNSNLIKVSKGDLVVEGGNLFNAWYVIYVSQTGEATVKGGVLTSSVASVLSTNGSQKGNENYSGTAVMNVEDGTLISEKDVAIYLPAGTLNISGGTIKGATAVYSKSGITRITGNPTIISESEKTGFTHSSNGCIASGDAMLIEACDYPNGEPEVYISGGFFTSTNAEGLAYYQFEGHTAREISITGGRFSNDVSEYVDDGYTCEQSAENWIVTPYDKGEMVVETVTPSSSGEVSAKLDGVYGNEDTKIDSEEGADESAPSGSVTDGEITINLSTKDGTSATTTSASLEVTKTAAESLDNASGLTVKSDVGSVSLPKEALKKVAGAGSAVTISMKESSITDEKVKAAYTVTVQDNENNNLLPETANDNGDITITVERPKNVNDLQAWYVAQISSSWVYVEQLDAEEINGQLQIQIKHLSTVALTEGTPSNQAVASVTTADGTTTPYTSLDDALSAVASSGGTLEVLTNGEVTLTETLKIEKDVTITGSGTLTLKAGDGFTDRQKLLNMEANLTIDGATVTLVPNKTGNGDAIQMGADTTEEITLTLKNDADLTIAENRNEGFQNALVMPAGNKGMVVVDGSTLAANNIDGNFANGGVFEIKNGANVTIDDCESYGLSVNKLTVAANSNVQVSNVKLAAIKTIGENASVTVKGNSTVTVEKSGGKLPYGSKWGVAAGVVDIGHGNQSGDKEDGSDIKDTPASLTVEQGSSIILTDNIGKKGADVNFVYLTTTGSIVNNGNITEVKYEEISGEDSNVYRIVYQAGEKIYAVVSAEKNSQDSTVSFTEPDGTPSVEGFTFVSWEYPDDWTVEDKSVTFTPGDAHEFTVDAALEAVVYTIKLNANGGTVDPSSVAANANGKLTDPLPTPTWEGYTFEGWFTAPEGGNEVTQDTEFFEDTTIYAHWTKDSDTDNRPSRPSHSSGGSTGGIGTRLPVADKDSTPAVTGFESDTKADLTVDGRYQFRITSLDGHTPVLTVNNTNFTVTLASRSGNDYFYVITCAGTPGSTAAVSVDGKYLLTATVGGSASGVVSDTTHPFTVAQGGTYQFRLTAAARPSFAAGSASFTVEYAGQEGNDYFYKVHAVGQAGDGCGFYINGEAQPVAVATIA